MRNVDEEPRQSVERFNVTCGGLTALLTLNGQNALVAEEVEVTAREPAVSVVHAVGADLL